MNLVIDKNSFEKTLSEAKLPVVVDFYADWCSPCKMMAPIIDELEKEFENKIIVLKVNIDDSPDIAQKYSVMSIPTIVVFKNGQPYKTNVGITSKENIIDMIQI